MRFILRRFPKFDQLLPVLAVIAVFVFGWEIYRFVWRLPSWLHYLKMGELLGIFSYAMLTGLVESLLLTGFLLGLSALLPARFLRDVFLVRGTAIALGWFLLLIAFWVLYERDGTLESYLTLWTGGTLLLTFLLAWASTRFRWLGVFLASLADRLIVFLFLLAPLTVLGLVVVFIRNVF